MSVTGPLMGIGAGVGAVTGFAGAMSARSSAESTIERLGEFITHSRIDMLRNTERLSREAQIAIGDLTNVAPEGLSAMETIASSIARGVTSDQYALEQSALRREQAAIDEMENVASSVPNPFVAAITGALGMAQAGAGLGGAIDSLGHTQDAAAMQPQFNAMQDRANAVSESLSVTETQIADMNRRIHANEAAMVFDRFQSLIRSPHALYAFSRYLPLPFRTAFENRIR